MTDGRKEQSREELARLMEQYGSRLLRMSALYLRDAALAEDAVQDAFLKAYRHLNDFRGDASEFTWLCKICVNVCRDYRKSAWLRHIDRRFHLDTLPEEAAEFSFPDDTVLTEVMNLPPKYREVVLLRYYQNMRLKDAAEVLGVTEGAVRKRLFTANGILRGRLKEWYFDEEE